MRDRDIIKTLKYVESRRQELLTIMFDAKFEDKKLDNIEYLVGDILGNITKCFDYCAIDLYENNIYAKEKPKKNLKIYFPFYENQLIDSKFSLSLLRTWNKHVYSYLKELTNKFSTNETLEGTTIPYSIARKVRELINSDKHNKVIEVDNNGPKDVLVKSEIGEIVILENQMNQNGWRTETFPGQNKKVVIAKSYRLIENEEEVANFCSLALWNTQKVLDSIYRKFLGSKIVI